jgi:DNA-binding CsgD family transcriptional regulator
MIVEEGQYIDRVYEAAAVSELWRGVLSDFARYADAKDAVLIAAHGDKFNGWVVSSPEFEELVLAHSVRFPTNIRTQRLMASRHSGFITDRDVLTEEEIQNEPVFQDFLVPRGYGNGVATTFKVPTGETAILHAERSRDDEPVSRAIVDRLDGLRPHFARAALLSTRLELERARAAAHMLDLLGLPGAVLGRGGRTLASNKLMTDLMPETVQDRPARLTLADPNADALLAKALARLEMVDRRDVVGSIPIAAHDRHPAIIVHVIPVRGVAHDVFANAACIVVLTPVVPHEVPNAEVIRGLFDLTPAEARIAEVVGSGLQPREAAVSLGIAEQTARSTLKRVFAKTGVARQAELVALLAGAQVPFRNI